MPIGRDISAKLKSVPATAEMVLTMKLRYLKITRFREISTSVTIYITFLYFSYLETQTAPKYAIKLTASIRTTSLGSPHA